MLELSLLGAVKFTFKFNKKLFPPKLHNCQLEYCSGVHVLLGNFELDISLFLNLESAVWFCIFLVCSKCMMYSRLNGNICNLCLLLMRLKLYKKYSRQKNPTNTWWTTNKGDLSRTTARSYDKSYDVIELMILILDWLHQCVWLIEAYNNSD